jgi:hypothetical protein
MQQKTELLQKRHVCRSNNKHSVNISKDEGEFFFEGRLHKLDEKFDHLHGRDVVRNGDQEMMIRLK